MPVARDRLADRLALRANVAPPHARLRLAMDGAAVSGRGALADEVASALRARGRPVVLVHAEDFLRPAALRFERGREDPDAFYEDELDRSGLAREVLVPLGPSGTGRYLPTRWDPVRDRATRTQYICAPEGAVTLVEGALLLWALPFDLTIHLHLSATALRRRVPVADAGRELPTYARYAAEVRPRETADVVVLLDDPVRPAVIDRRAPAEITAG